MSTEFRFDSTTVAPWPVVGTLCERELVRFLRQKNRVFGALTDHIVRFYIASCRFVMNRETS